MSTVSSDAFRNQACPRVRLRTSMVRYCGQPTAWSTVDLSDGGAFVESAEVFREGTELDLSLSLPSQDGVLSLATRGRVAWTNRLAQPRKPSFPQGMGVQFLGMRAGDRAVLRAYLKRVAPEACGPLRSGAKESVRQRGRKTPPRSQPPLRGGSATARRGEGESACRVGKRARKRRLPSPGSRIGPYRILGVLGTGGGGDVVLAEHERLDRKVALKKLGAELAHDDRLVRRFVDEARVVSQIQHPNIVDVSDFIHDGHDYYCVMELLDGCNLSELDRRQGRLPLYRLLRILLQLCEALQAVHRAGVVHRDLKPDNVMIVQRDGVQDFVKLVDFGVAKLRDPTDGRSLHATAVDQVLGTPEYVAPEQLLQEPVDARADIYGVGAILFRMLFGRTPSRASNWGDLLAYHCKGGAPELTDEEKERIPSGLLELMLGCLDRNPARRPQSVEEVARGLLRSLGSAWAADVMAKPKAAVGRRSPSRSPLMRWAGWILRGLIFVAAALLLH